MRLENSRLNKLYQNLEINNIKLFSVDDWITEFSKLLVFRYMVDVYYLKFNWLYRARTNFDNDIPIDFFKHTKNIWAPPYKKVKKQGRCNRKGQSMLYCSTDVMTTIFETRPLPNTYYYNYGVHS